ncbi:MAG: glycosyltransferase [Acidobacteriota bacterium]|nr:glycosyltransferase [Acidobacteriota bacterium]
MRASLRAEYERSGRPSLDDPLNADPLVSVIIPCYNYGYYLEDAILSAILACSHPMEIVVVDDGSELEESIKAVDALRERYRFRLVRQANKGQNGARVGGLSLSRGKFIQFLDADDLLAPGKIDLQIGMMSGETPVDIAVCEYELCDADGGGRRLITPSTLAGFTFTEHDFLFRWERGFSVPIHCALFTRDVLSSEQFPSVTKGGKEDWIFWVILAHKLPRFQFHPDVLGLYRIHGHNTFTKPEAMGMDFLRACLYLLRTGRGPGEDFPGACVEHFRKAYLEAIKREAVAASGSGLARPVDIEGLRAELASRAENLQHLLDEERQRRMDAEARQDLAASQAAHYENLLEEQQRQRADAENRLADAASDAAHNQNLLDEQRRRLIDAESQLARATARAEHYTILQEEQRQRRIDLNTLHTSHEAALAREASLKQSFSWRITTPLRYLASLLRFR